jgi:hypothetical protein
VDTRVLLIVLVRGLQLCLLRSVQARHSRHTHRGTSVVVQTHTTSSTSCADHDVVGLCVEGLRGWVQQRPSVCSGSTAALLA